MKIDKTQWKINKDRTRDALFGCVYMSRGWYVKGILKLTETRLEILK